MNNSLTKATLLFLQSTQPTFDQMNVMLQSDEPQIHMLHHMCGDLTNLYLKFLKIDSKPLTQMTSSMWSIRRERTKSREGLVIGAETRLYLTQMKEAGVMSSADRTEFYDSVDSTL